MTLSHTWGHCSIASSCKTSVTMSSCSSMMAAVTVLPGYVANMPRWLLLLNSDTLVSADNLQRLLDYADTLPEDVVCVGPKLLNPDGSLQSEGCFGSSHHEMFVKHFKIGSLLSTFQPNSSILHNIQK